MSTEEERQLIQRLDDAVGFMKWAILRQSQSTWLVSIQEPNPSKDWYASGVSPSHAMRNAIERIRSNDTPDFLPFSKVSWWCPECSTEWDKEKEGICPECGNECGNERIGFHGNPDANENGDIVR